MRHTRTWREAGAASARGARACRRNGWGSWLLAAHVHARRAAAQCALFFGGPRFVFYVILKVAHGWRPPESRQRHAHAYGRDAAARAQPRRGPDGLASPAPALLRRDAAARGCGSAMLRGRAVAPHALLLHQHGPRLLQQQRAGRWALPGRPWRVLEQEQRGAVCRPFRRCGRGAAVEPHHRRDRWSLRAERGAINTLATAHKQCQRSFIVPLLSTAL